MYIYIYRLYAGAMSAIARLGVGCAGSVVGTLQHHTMMGGTHARICGAGRRITHGVGLFSNGFDGRTLINTLGVSLNLLVLYKPTYIDFDTSRVISHD